ncbi:MAG: hypothetical protein AABY22_35000 [Nanoarchaeota archaeon]
MPYNKNGKKEHIYRYDDDEWWKCDNCQVIFIGDSLISISIFDTVFGQTGALVCPFCYSEYIKIWCVGCDDPNHDNIKCPCVACIENYDDNNLGHMNKNDDFENW